MVRDDPNGAKKSVLSTCAHVDSLAHHQSPFELDVVGRTRRFAAVVHDHASAQAFVELLDSVGRTRRLPIILEHQGAQTLHHGWYAAGGALVALLLCSILTIFYLLGMLAKHPGNTTRTFYFDVGRPENSIIGGELARQNVSQAPRSRELQALPRQSSARQATQQPGAVTTSPNFTTASPTAEAKAKSAAPLPAPVPTSTKDELPSSLDERQPLSKVLATKQAFQTGRIQTWFEDGQEGFVLADPPQQGETTSCRTMILWRSGAAQGDVTKSTVCPDGGSSDK